MYKELDLIVLNENIPSENVFKGDVGTIVSIYGEGEAFEVEFVTFYGETIALLTLNYDQIRKIKESELMSVREIL